MLRGQVLGAIIAPLTAIAALVNAPLQNLYGLIDARIEQLQAQGDTRRGTGADTAVPTPEPTEPQELTKPPRNRCPTSLGARHPEPTETQEADEDGSS